MRATAIAAALVIGFASISPAQGPVSDAPPRPRGSIAGIVRSVTGEGVGGALIRLRTWRPLVSALPDAWTRPDERFEIDGLVAGSYFVDLLIPGYPRVIYGGDTTEDGLPVKVRNGRTAGGIVFEVPAGGTIQGRVITGSGEGAG